MRHILIAYFSRRGENYVNGKIQNLPVGNTERAAEKIADLTGGTLFHIQPVRPYADDYRGCVEESREELRSNARPEIVGGVEDPAAYDTVILGYPNWCGTMPMPVWTFLESMDFSGKTIWPLCTNEGSGMGRSEEDIRKLCPGAKVEKGLSVRGCQVESAGPEIQAWLEEAGLLKEENRA